MKSLLMILVVFSLSVFVFADNNIGLKNSDISKNFASQQSITGKYRPDNISLGITGSITRTQIVINDVPSYLWQHGCGPTALGMVIGYYDIRGFSDLIEGDASTQNTIVNNAIANSEHYDDYAQPIDYYPDLFTDLSEIGGAHISNCVADFMETSWSSEENRYGWSWGDMIGTAFTNYVLMCNSDYFATTTDVWFSESSWETYKNEINNERPVVLLVDSDGDGYTDHFVTGIGFDESNSTYAIYDTWDNDIHWYQWRQISNSYGWGIYGFSILEIDCNLTAPENISISVASDSVSISWDAVLGAISYSVYSDIESEGDFSTLEWNGANTNWSEPVSGMKKFYRVTAIK